MQLTIAPEISISKDGEQSGLNISQRQKSESHSLEANKFHDTSLRGEEEHKILLVEEIQNSLRKNSHDIPKAQIVEDEINLDS